MTDWLLSVDPGKRGCGCALWHRGVLRAAGYVAPAERAATLEKAIESMSGAVLAWALEITRGEIKQGQLVCELPQTYGGYADKGDANTLIALACVVGAILGALGCPSNTITMPHGWKGNIPKPDKKADYERDGYIVEGRARAALVPSEAAIVQWPKNWKHKLDVADGLGIGLWSLGRAFT